MNPSPPKNKNLFLILIFVYANNLGLIFTNWNFFVQIKIFVNKSHKLGLILPQSN